MCTSFTRTTTNNPKFTWSNQFSLTTTGQSHRRWRGPGTAGPELSSFLLAAKDIKKIRKTWQKLWISLFLPTAAVCWRWSSCFCKTIQTESVFGFKWSHPSIWAFGSLKTSKILWHWRLVCSYRCIAVNAAHTVEIDRGQTLVRQAVVKAASWAIAAFLLCVVQCHLKHEHKRTISLRNTAS